MTKESYTTSRDISWPLHKFYPKAHVNLFVTKISRFMQLCGNIKSKNTILSFQVGSSKAQTFEIFDTISGL